MRYYGIQNELKSYLNRLEKENNILPTKYEIDIINNRIENLKSNNIWKIYGLGFNDLDADLYLNRANVNNLLGRCEIIWFVRGMKSLGLYNNMICWSLRSYQNVGTGNTVYSLGGYDTCNLTSQNSPTWGMDGITFGNSSFLISSAKNIVNPPYIFSSTIFNWKLIDGTSQSLNCFQQNNRFNISISELTNIGRLFRTTDNSSVLDDFRFSMNLTNNTPYLYNSWINGNTKTVRVNKGTFSQSKNYSGDVYNSTLASYIIGAANNNGANSLNGFISINLLISIKPTDSISNLLLTEDLIINTVGYNLGLS